MNNQNNIINKSWIPTIGGQNDWLFKKLSSPYEGWSISTDNGFIDVPLNSIDAAIYHLLSKVIHNHLKVALLIPKVKRGIGLGLVTYLSVNRLLAKHKRLNYRDSIEVDLSQEQKIIIATKHRKLRDFFLNSSLKFNGRRFSFEKFPMQRLTPQGTSVPLRKGELRDFINIAPIIFYHFDKIPKYPEDIYNACVIAELGENDSEEIVNKLTRFIKDIDASSSFVLMNQNSTNTIEILSKSGFDFINLTNDELLFEHAVTTTSLPSFAGYLTGKNTQSEVEIEIVDDERVADKLNEIWNILSHLTKQCNNLNIKLPFLLVKAWGVYYSLKDLAVPLPTIEKYLKTDSWLKTISYSIDQIGNFPLSKLDSNSEEVLTAYWGGLCSLFRDIYKLLKENPIKYHKLAEFVVDNYNRNKSWYLVFPSDYQAHTFKQELQVEFGWNEQDSSIKVASLKFLVRNAEECDNVVMPGYCKKNDIPKLLSLFPKRIRFYVFKTELNAIAGMNYSITQNQQNIDEISKRSLSKLGYSINSKNTSRPRLLFEKDAEILIEHAKDLSQSEKNKEDNFFMDWTEYLPEWDEPTDENVTSESQMGEEEYIDAIKVTLDDEIIFLSSEQEVLVYGSDGNVISKYAEALEEGDIIMTYSDEKEKEIFEEIINRTRELSGVDYRLIEQWKIIIDTLRKQYIPNNKELMNSYCEILIKKGCMRHIATMLSWLKGYTLAPQELDDIRSLIEMAGVKNSSILATLINREVNRLRTFHRQLGKSLKKRISLVVQQDSEETISDKDSEIDEILESVRPLKVIAMGDQKVVVPKSKINRYILH